LAPGLAQMAGGWQGNGGLLCSTGGALGGSVVGTGV